MSACLANVHTRQEALLYLHVIDLVKGFFIGAVLGDGQYS